MSSPPRWYCVGTRIRQTKNVKLFWYLKFCSYSGFCIGHLPHIILVQAHPPKMTEWRGGSRPKRIQIESRHCLPGFATVAVKCLQLWFWVSKLKTRRKSETDVGELTLSWPTCLAWNSLYAWSERTRPNMAEQRAELISFTPASTLQLGEGGGGGVGDGLGLPPRPSLRISNSQIWNLSDLLFKAPSK